MIETVYDGPSRDSWPYDYVVNALIFFAMAPDQLDHYIVRDFPTTLFHGAVTDFESGNAKEVVSFIWAEVLGTGKTISEWIDEPSYESADLERDFSELFSQLYDVGIDQIWSHWKESRAKAIKLLADIGWREIPDSPFIGCEEILNEYSYGAYSEAVESGA